MTKAPSFTVLTLALAGGWIAGIALGQYQPLWIHGLWPWGFLGLMLVAASALFFNETLRLRWASVMLVMILLGGQYAVWREERDWVTHPLVRRGAQEDLQVTGIVYPQLKAGSTKHWLHLEAPESGWIIADIRRKATQARWPEVGSRVRLSGKFRLPRRPILPDPLAGFDEHRYLRSMGALGMLESIPARSLTVLNPAPVNAMTALLRATDIVRVRLRDSFFTVLGPVHGALAASMVLGERAVGVPKAAHEAFAQTGLIHLLAASGMNVGIVAGSILLGFSLIERGWLYLRPKSRRFRSGLRHLKFFIALMAVIAYMLLTGMPPSIQRAGVMILLALVLKWRHQAWPAVPLLAVSVSLLLLFTPFAVQSLGLQLSVLTTLGILTFLPPLQSWVKHPRLSWPWVTVLVPLSAQIWATPLLVPTFHTVPLLSTLLNIPAVWLSAPVTALGAALSTLGMIWPPAWQGLILLKPCLMALLALAEWGQSQHQTVWTLAAWPWPITVAWLMVLVAWAICLNWPFVRALEKSLVLAGFTLVFASVSVGGNWFQPDVREFWPLGNRHGVLVSNAHHQTTLSVPASLSYWEARALADALKARNVQRVDRLKLWPPDAGQSEGFKPKWLKRPIAHVVHHAPLPAGLSTFSPTPTRTFWVDAQKNRLLQPGRLYMIAP